MIIYTYLGIIFFILTGVGLLLVWHLANDEDD